MISEFKDMGLQPQIMQAVEALGFTQPTPIQQSAIPALMEGRNVFGQAQTGTGKTAAFVLPMLQQIKAGKGIVQALIVVPTRELAIQVTEAAASMARFTGLRVLTVYGGQPYSVQMRALQRGVDVVVGTPGRLLDLLRKEVLSLSQLKFLVLDEADEMLDMGFIEDIEAIISQAPPERQMSLFSATLPEAVRKLSRRYLTNPVEIKIDPSSITVAEIEQRYVRVREEDKMEALVRILQVEEVKSALIFCRTRIHTQEIADELARRGLQAESLHGDLNQSRREFVMGRFRNGTISLLAATDVAARGLDIDDVSHVFNYDVPDGGDEYVHRIGRTGRAGRKGIAVTFLSPRERGLLKMIEAHTHQPIVEMKVPNREEILARRDARFIASLSQKLGQGSISREREMIAKLMETSFDMVEIAAAAIQLARAGEAELQIQDMRELPAEKSYKSEKRFEKPGDARTERRSKAHNEHPARPSKPAWDGNAVAIETLLAKHAGRKGEQQGEPGMIRLRMNLGVTHGLRPGDVVGAIAGEVGIPGKAIGEIDIHENHTFVDVAEAHAGQVLAGSAGQYSLRGRQVWLTLAS